MTEFDGTHVDGYEAHEATPGEVVEWPAGKPRTYGVSPKVIASAATAVVVYVVAGFGLDLPEEVVAALQVVLAAVAGLVAPPGSVEFDR